LARSNHAVRWGAALVAMGLTGVPLSAAPAAAAQPPGTDSAIGAGEALFWGNFQIDATSGPSGESPSGTVDVEGVFTFDGPVTCLNVQANVATLNVETNDFGLFTMMVTDNATVGTPDVIEGFPIGRLPTDCSPIPPGSGVITTEVGGGGIVVVDATPNPK
jgi:hypothetical protein